MARIGLCEIRSGPAKAPAGNWSVAADVGGNHRAPADHIGLIERGVRNASLTLANDLARALGTSLSKMMIVAEKVRIPSEKSP